MSVQVADVAGVFHLKVVDFLWIVACDEVTAANELALVGKRSAAIGLHDFIVVIVRDGHDQQRVLWVEYRGLACLSGNLLCDAHFHPDGGSSSTTRTRRRP